MPYRVRRPARYNGATSRRQYWRVKTQTNQFAYKSMKFAIVGAGAIGAFVGAVLSRAGEDVTLIARGNHLRAMQEHGVRVRGEIGDFVAHPAALEDPAAAGIVDVVLLTLKAHSLTSMAPRLAPLFGPD